MKSLLLMRHAEAATAAADFSDLSRPLTASGRTQAAVLGRYLQGLGIAPDRVECSSAIRARETADAVIAAAAWTAAAMPFEHLYNAGAEALVAQARRQPNDVRQLILIAHAPGIAEAVSLLTTRHADVALICAAATVAEIVLDVDHWAGIGAGTGALRLLLPP
jgi:phosphohistidine phosphatase